MHVQHLGRGLGPEGETSYTGQAPTKVREMSATRPSQRGGRCDAGRRADCATRVRTASALANRLRRPVAISAADSALLRRLGTPLTSPFPRALIGTGPFPVQGGA
ncbi:hypothetical protein WKI68_40015 [Streptomyces sp. MS1.HAVA.3]|uniref:Uncharacterized protein n=1 Tax=Streptomyces caledonius TaxID=3134107 RepID=A0ABU8UCW3_9ACTN